MIILQIITAVFAVACAWLNKWPVKLMQAYWTQGSHVRQERAFHAANACVKGLWAAAVAWQHFGATWKAVAFGGLLGLIQWLVFDPVLNLFIGKPPFYLGSTAFLDKLVKNGKIKAGVVLLLIITLNLFLNRWNY